MTLGLHASRACIARRGLPTSFDQLAEHDLIGPDEVTPFVREVLAKQPGVDLRSFALRSNSDVLHLAAIAGGVGIGVAQVSLASRDPSLVRMLLDAFSHDLPLWIAMHEDLRTSPRCRAVFDTMVRGLSPIAT